MRESPFSKGHVKVGVPRSLRRMDREIDGTPPLAKAYAKLRTSVRNTCPPALWNGLRQLKRAIKGH